MSGPKADRIVPREEIVKQMKQRNAFRELQSQSRMFTKRCEALLTQANEMLIQHDLRMPEAQNWDRMFDRCPENALRNLQSHIMALQALARGTEANLSDRRTELRRQYDKVCGAHAELMEAKRELSQLLSQTEADSIHADLVAFLNQPVASVPVLPETRSQISDLERAEQTQCEYWDKIHDLRKRITASVHEREFKEIQKSESVLLARAIAQLDTLSVLIQNTSGINDRELGGWVQSIENIKALRSAEEITRRANELAENWKAAANELEGRERFVQEVEAQLCRLEGIVDEAVLHDLKDKYAAMRADEETCLKVLEEDVQNHILIAEQQQMAVMKREALEGVLCEMGYVVSDRSRGDDCLSLVFDDAAEKDGYGVLVIASENSDDVQFQVVRRGGGNGGHAGNSEREDAEREEKFCDEYVLIREKMKERGFIQQKVSHVQAGVLPVAKHAKSRSRIAPVKRQVRQNDETMFRRQNDQQMRGQS